MQNSKIDSFIESLLQDTHFSANIVAARRSEPRIAQFSDIPNGIRPEIRNVLQNRGIRQLYTHQAEVIRELLRGQNIVISSGVASGKSLCYQVPILNDLLCLPASRSLLLYPTKALAQDQYEKLCELLVLLKSELKAGSNFKPGIYDGDTATDIRTLLRKNSSMILSNPDMLHLGILPNHTLWSSFFSNLRYVVIDEVHIYRGVFGSQFANVLRRLKRICRFYRSKPQFIFTSATLSNSRELCENLIEAPVQIVDSDHSPSGERHFFVFNPPMVNQKLGIRRSAIVESTSLAKQFLKTGCQAILFSETRRSIEILFMYLIGKSWLNERIRSYRSGYLAEHRRRIESELRNHEVDLVVSTNALELGIDIGGLDAVFINGYPGTICGTIQQSGRAGRGSSTALTVLLATSNPLDQYICRHPEYLFEKNPEQALIDPNNTEILLKHLHCAICEMALLEDEGFGALEAHELFPYLHILLEDGKIRMIGARYLGNPGDYPASEISLRNMSSQYQLCSEDRMIGYVDEVSSHWMVHPNAIYLHHGDTWIVKNRDPEKKVIELEQVSVNYYTQASKQTTIELNRLLEAQATSSGNKYLGNVTVTSQTVGFKKVRFFTQEILGYEDLDLPPLVLQTVAWWISLSPASVEKIKAQGLWRNEAIKYGKDWNKICSEVRIRDKHTCQHCGIRESEKAHDVHHIIPFRKFGNMEEANKPDNLITLCPRCHRLAEQSVMIQSGLAAVAYLIGNLAPLYVMCEQKDIGIHSEESSSLAEGNPVIVIYDSIPGGIGLSRKLYHQQDLLVAEALKAVSTCPCEEGCPACVGPVAENGEGAKEHALAILNELCLKHGSNN